MWNYKGVIFLYVIDFICIKYTEKFKITTIQTEFILSPIHKALNSGVLLKPWCQGFC